MKRNIFTQLENWKNQKSRKPLILRGARQVGKTYILKKFGQSSFPVFHYINFENDELLKSIFSKNLNPHRILDELCLHLNTSINAKTDLVIFDEIQQNPRALTALKYFNEEMPHLAICAAGSLLGISLNDSSFPVGKITFLDLYPMNFKEFLLAIGKYQLLHHIEYNDLSSQILETAHSQLWDLWKRYLIVGGLPEIVKTYRDNYDNQFEAFKLVVQGQTNLFMTYMVDIAKHSGKTNALQIEQIWKNVPAQLARAIDSKAKKFQFKNVIPGIRGYERLSNPISWLEKTNLLIRTSIVNKANEPLFSYAKENRFKLYFFDVGLLRAMNNLEPITILKYDYGSYKGYVAENFVAQELITGNVRELFSWEGRTSEVEFLVATSQGIIPLEVKAGSITKLKSLKVFEEKYIPQKSYVLCGKNISKQNNRTYLPIYMAGKLVESLLQRTA